MIGLRDKISDHSSGIVFYSLTPPKITTDQDRVSVIAANQIERLKHLNIDGLILYDIQDESLRTDKDRTFSFIPTISPEVYSKTFLSSLQVPKIIYKSIANQTRESFETWLQENKDIGYTVFVGASSHQQIEATKFSLSDAYSLKEQSFPDLLLGGITIPERHSRKKDEHLRICRKFDSGCRFFVSQCVYNVNDTKNLLSDYYYNSLESDSKCAPIIFTLAPCGSLKTLQFMEWLGIEVPGWLYNDLKHAKDILGSSIQTSKNIASEILEYADKKSMPVGFNIESISIKKEEIEAAQEILLSVLDMVKPGDQLLKK